MFITITCSHRDLFGPTLKLLEKPIGINNCCLLVNPGSIIDLFPEKNDLFIDQEIAYPEERKNQLIKNISLLVRHGGEKIIIIGHRGCLAYEERKLSEETQFIHLERAQKIIAKTSGKPVEIIWAIPPKDNNPARFLRLIFGDYGQRITTPIKGINERGEIIYA